MEADALFTAVCFDMETDDVFAGIESDVVIDDEISGVGVRTGATSGIFVEDVAILVESGVEGKTNVMSDVAVESEDIVTT